jgi:hypothetical protein
MKEAILIPAIYEGSRDLKDRSKKLIFQTNEITPQQAADLQICVQGFVYLAIKIDPFRKDEVDFITDIKSDFNDLGKTPSQIQRNVLYRIWQLDNQGYQDFNLYYIFRMNVIINSLKKELP